MIFRLDSFSYSKNITTHISGYNQSAFEVLGKNDKQQKFLRQNYKALIEKSLQNFYTESFRWNKWVKVDEEPREIDIYTSYPFLDRTWVSKGKEDKGKIEKEWKEKRKKKRRKRTTFGYQRGEKGIDFTLGEREYSYKKPLYASFEKLEEWKSLLKSFPFLETWEGYSKPLIFCAYCDLLKMCVQDGYDKETIEALLKEIKWLYFQNNIDFAPLLSKVSWVIAAWLRYVGHAAVHELDSESVKSYFSYFEEERDWKTHQEKHRKLFKKMLRKRPKAVNWTYVGIGTIAILSVVWTKVAEIINEPIAIETSAWPIGKKIQYPWQEKDDDAIPAEEIDNELLFRDYENLYDHGATWISVLTIPDKDEFDHHKHGHPHEHEIGHFHKHNDFSNLEETVENNEVIDFDLVKLAFYETIKTVRWKDAVKKADFEVWIVDEIRVEDLPGHVIGLYKSRADNPTDKDVYLDEELLKRGNTREVIHVIIHELVHGLTWTSASTMRNEWLTEAITQHILYKLTNHDVYDEYDPYAPHILNMLMIDKAYWGYDWFENFSAKLYYNYKNSDSQPPNRDYAKHLQKVIRIFSEDIVDPVAIAFFCWWTKWIIAARSHSLQTPWTRDALTDLIIRYQQSYFYEIDKLDISDAEKAKKWMNYLLENAEELATRSPKDQLPGNVPDVDFETNENLWHQRPQKEEKNDEQDTWWEWIGTGSGWRGWGNGKGNWTSQGREWGLDWFFNTRKQFEEEIAEEIQWSWSKYAGVQVDTFNFTGKWEYDPNYFSYQVDSTLRENIYNKLFKPRWASYQQPSKAEEKVINFLHMKYMKDLEYLAEKLRIHLFSDEAYEDRKKDQNFIFHYNDPKYGLRQASWTIIKEYLEEKDLVWESVSRRTITYLAEECEKNWTISLDEIISTTTLRATITQQVDSIFHIYNFEETVPFFDELYKGKHEAVDKIMEDQAAFIKSQIDVSFKIHDDEQAKEEIIRYMNGQGVWFSQAVEEYFRQQNKKNAADMLKKSDWFKHTLDQYLDPMIKDRSPLAKEIYDFLDEVNSDIRDYFIYLVGTLGVYLLAFFAVYTKRRRKTMKELAKKFNELYSGKLSFPIDNRLDTLEAENQNKRTPYTVSAIFCLVMSVICLNVSDMDSLKLKVVSKNAQEHLDNFPTWNDQARTYRAVSKMHDVVKYPELFTEDEVREYYINLWAVEPYKLYTVVMWGQELTQRQLAWVKRIFTKLAKEFKDGKKVDEKVVADTHRKILSVVDPYGHNEYRDIWSYRWMIGLILFMLSAVWAALVWLGEVKYRIQRVHKFRDEIAKLIKEKDYLSVSELSTIGLVVDEDEKKEWFEDREDIKDGLTKLGHTISTASIEELVEELWASHTVKRSSSRDFLSYLEVSKEDSRNLFEEAEAYLAGQWWKLIPENYDKIVINFSRSHLVPETKKSIMYQYRDSPEGVLEEISYNFLEHYLPRILFARKHNLPVTAFVNSIPISHETVSFTNVKMLKKMLFKLEQLAGATAGASPIALAVLTEQIDKAHIEDLQLHWDYSKALLVDFKK